MVHVTDTYLKYCISLFLKHTLPALLVPLWLHWQPNAELFRSVECHLYEMYLAD